MKMPESPPMMNIATNAIALSIAVVYWMRPPHIVPSQLNTLMADGQGDHHRGEHERRAQRGVHAGLEHVVAPDDEAETGDAGDGEHHRLVAEERLAGERGDDVRDHAHRGQDHDVHRRVRVEPEQVLPEQRLSATDDRRGVRDRPADGLKKFVPAVRSSNCITRAEVSTGNANACKSAVMNIAQTVIGMRNIFMPGRGA